MDFRGMEDAIIYAQRRWPGLELRIDGRESASGPCPFKNKGTDRFVISIQGHYFCRQCGQKGWLDEEEVQVLSPEERRLRALEAEQADIRRKQVELEKRMSALEWMAHTTEHRQYHEAMREEDIQWWFQQGIYKDAIKEYQLGICLGGCPTDKEHRASYTIPVLDSKWRQLLNIQHRLIGATNGDKYRPHRSGLGRQLFNSRHVFAKQPSLGIGLVEGAKKSIVLTQHGFLAMGMPGISTFDMRWLKHFRGVKRLWLAPDPDAYDQMKALGKQIQQAVDAKVTILTLFDKPDDFFVKGGTESTFKEVIRYGRPV